jgi:hypothetical protein
LFSLFFTLISLAQVGMGNLTACACGSKVQRVGGEMKLIHPCPCSSMNVAMEKMLLTRKLCENCLGVHVSAWVRSAVVPGPYEGLVMDKNRRMTMKTSIYGRLALRDR